MAATVFQALSERNGQLRGLIENANSVFGVFARRNADLAQIFQILPTFLHESRLTLSRLNGFAINTDPLVQQLRPAARQLSPTLIAAGRLAPDLRRFLAGLRGTIAASGTGFPALRSLLDDDLPPLLSRLGISVGGRTPYLAQLTPLVQVLHDYRHEITAFLANSAAATNYSQPAPERGFKPVKILRTTSPLNPQSLATFSQRLTPDRANPYFEPLGYQRLASGLETFASTPCSAGATATLPSAATVANDPSFNVRTGGSVPDATELFERLRFYAFGDTSTTKRVPAPPCRKQGPFGSLGAHPQSHPYLQVRAQRP